MLLRLILMALFLMLSAVPLAAQVSSGDYEELVIGVDSTGKTITGYFESRTGGGSGGGPGFSCIFYLKGSMKGEPPYKIETWFPTDKTRKNLISGTLAPVQVDGVASLKIELKSEHGGCANVQQFAGQDGALFGLDAPGKWQSIRVVSAVKTHFYDEASDAKKRKAYLVRGNPIRVYESRPGWVRAEYKADEKTTSGWIKENDLFPADPPAQ